MNNAATVTPLSTPAAQSAYHARDIEWIKESNGVYRNPWTGHSIRKEGKAWYVYNFDGLALDYDGQWRDRSETVKASHPTLLWAKGFAGAALMDTE